MAERASNCPNCGAEWGANLMGRIEHDRVADWMCLGCGSKWVRGELPASAHQEDSK